MNGIAATIRIREETPAERLPVIIAVTAFARSEEKEACLAAGMQDFIGKPFTLREVGRALRQWAEKRAPSST